MATTTKLSFATRALVSTATFILLSAASSAEEARRCYWCGPLAEQVHRSRRAPPCDTLEDNVTACDYGLMHCAIVASSPPLVESRICVKLYQDECYPLYCNSTKSWKMTCPCRGDLCNGANTDRENEAFAILDKLVAKTYSNRVKRTALPSPHVIKDNDNKQIMNNYTKIEDEETNQNITDDMLSDQPMEEIKENVVDETNNITSEVDKNIQEDKEANTSQQIETDKSAAHNSDETEKENNSDKTLEATREPKNMAIPKQEMTTEKSVKTIKSSMESPTAEALQQNVSPVVIEKTTEQSTIHMTDTTHLTTWEHVEITPEPSVPGKNDAIRICRDLFTVINWLLVHKLMQW